MSETIKNLKEAFAGESQANRRYLTFAIKADEEDLSNIAKLFRAAAAAETVHAMNHLRIAGEVGMTISNLDEAISGETFEFTKMYPKFLEVARKERNKRAEWSFNVANQVEEIHAGLFQTALTTLKNSGDLSPVEYYVCQVCGHTVDGNAPDKCPICGAPNSKYIKVD